MPISRNDSAILLPQFFTRTSWAFCLVLILLVASEVRSEEPQSAAPAVEFERDVLPILKTHCFDCHDGETQKSKLRLDNVVGLLKGGDSGEPLFIRGNSDESLLIKRVTAVNPKERMPPDGDRLSPDQVELLRTWIKGGAPIPGADNAAESLKLKTSHWSFQPVKRPPGRNIDDFVQAKLHEHRLELSPAADKSTLIRRLYLVMHGMPPTPQEVQAFENDRRPDAYARLVDAVLDSPRFGERWARHWMDVVRYADSNGFETNRERKTAFPYRDWIIESFNADKPYDVFIKEQLAGDQLGVDAATGFLVAGPYDIVKSPDINLTLMQRQDELADMVNTTGTAFLGVTMGCARCHNHKFDPVLQKDYYSMQAVFEGVRHGERILRESMNANVEAELAEARAIEKMLKTKLDGFRQQARANPVSGKPALRPAVQASINEDRFPATEAFAVKFTIGASSSGEPCLDELEIYNEAGENVALAGRVSTSGTLPGFAIHKQEHINDGKTGNEHSWISSTPGQGWVQIDLPAKMRIQRIVWGRDRNRAFADRVPLKYTIEAATEPGKWRVLSCSDDRESFNGVEPDDDAFTVRLAPADAAAARQTQADLAAVQGRIAQISNSKLAWVGTFAQPGPTYRLYRGEPTQKREPVSPDALSVFGTLGLSADSPEHQRRLKFAEWVASPQNPLTARVMMNRLWQYTFGTGIVDTPSDFGANGTPPTHPELLDWLADEFVQSGWSVKHMQRLILQSATFQQSSASRANAAAVDAGGRLLWRYTPRRLEAEAIRDSMLAVSGALDLKMGGPGFYLMDVVEENVMHYFPKEKFTPAEFRRMVYQFRIRQTTDSIFSSFDCPDGGSVMPKRSRSNTPLQALNLFNSSFVLQQSEILAQRLVTEAGDSLEQQIQLAFHLFYARQPDAIEQAASSAIIREHGLQSFARALFNTSEFLFVF